MTSQRVVPPKRLYRSKRDRQIAGICGGIAEYLNVDPSVVRLVWIVLTLMGGTGFAVYLICWFVIPENPEQLL
jgi:phage shock protein PspC (stress-responsive transcriptional regulator)